MRGRLRSTDYGHLSCAVLPLGRTNKYACSRGRKAAHRELVDLMSRVNNLRNESYHCVAVRGCGWPSSKIKYTLRPYFMQDLLRHREKQKLFLPVSYDQHCVLEYIIADDSISPNFGLVCFCSQCRNYYSSVGRSLFRYQQALAELVRGRVGQAPLK